MDSIWFEITVFILAGFLALFLLVSIYVMYKISQIVEKVNGIVEKAESVADKAEHMADFFSKTSSSVSILKLISNISDAFSKKHKSKK